MTRRLMLATTVVLTVVLFVMVLQAADPLRAAVAAVGVLACGGLGFRLLACWDATTVLVHVLGLALIASLLLGSIATNVNAHNAAPYNPVLWWVLAHRIVCVIVVLMWPYWLDRTRAPYRLPLL